MGLLHFIQKRQKYHTVHVKIGGASLNALLANTPIKRMVGLMYRDSIAPEECMLFSFGTDGKPGIWMRNMRFPIDIIWLDSEMTVVDIFESAEPCTQLHCRTMKPAAKAKYVIEANAGLVKRYGIRTGSKASFDMRPNRHD